MTLPALNIKRDQLAKFAPDHDTIIQFERLFQAVDDMKNLSTEASLVLAGNAMARIAPTKSRATTVIKINSSVTETISVTAATDIYIDVSGNTLTISNMVDGSKLQFHNESGGNANLNFSIKIGSNVITAPSIMPNGDSYELTYDLGDNQWVM